MRELIIEYLLYLKAIAFTWTAAEAEILYNPSVEFNPPVRFLQTSGHKAALGIAYDTANFQITFNDATSEAKFKHLVNKLVVHPTRGLGATALYGDVFADFVAPAASSGGNPPTSLPSAPPPPPPPPLPPASPPPPKVKPDTLFAYPVSLSNALLVQLMREAKDLNCKKFPASATFLLRNMVESLLKHIIDQQSANPASKTLDLESALNLCASNAVTLSTSDKAILADSKKTHLAYLNLGAHGNVIPNPLRVLAARDAIDQFVKKNI